MHVTLTPGLSPSFGVDTGAAPPAAPPPPPTPQASAPRPTSPAALAAALTKLSGLSGDLLALALEHEGNREEADGARSLIRAAGSRVTLDHQHRQQEIQKAIDAAKNKSWWSDFTAVFRYVAIGAAACTGVWGLAAAALMTAAVIIQKEHPKIAIGLECTAAAFMLYDAVGSIAGGATAWGTSATAKGISAGGKDLSAIAFAGLGTGTLMTSHYEAATETADANRLLWQQLVEQQRGEQRENLDLLKELGALDERATQSFIAIIKGRADLAAAAIRA
jgi:hypothetical protein